MRQNNMRLLAPRYGTTLAPAGERLRAFPFHFIILHGEELRGTHFLFSATRYRSFKRNRGGSNANRCRCANRSSPGARSAFAAFQHIRGVGVFRAPPQQQRCRTKHLRLAPPCVYHCVERNALGLDHLLVRISAGFSIITLRFVRTLSARVLQCVSGRHTMEHLPFLPPTLLSRKRSLAVPRTPLERSRATPLRHPANFRTV